MLYHSMFASVLLACALMGPAAVAKDAKLSEVRMQPAQFSEYRASIETALQSDESLAQMSLEHREEVRVILRRMDATLNGVSSIDQLPEKARRELFNDQERLHVLLGQAEEDSRLICRREKTTGSNRARSVCISVAERRRQSEGAHDALRRRHPVDALKGVN